MKIGLTSKRPSSPSPTFTARRKISLYRLTPDASNGHWDLARVSREFDSASGNLTDSIIEQLNCWSSEASPFRNFHLHNAEGSRYPDKILLLDGSPNRLPLAGETKRVADEYLQAKGLSIPVIVVNRREDLLARIAQAPGQTLILSQAAQRSLFDVQLAKALQERGAVIVPGPLTAPGGPLSNKKNTYEILNSGWFGLEEQNGGPPRVTGRYQPVSVNGAGASAIAETILDTAKLLAEKWGASTLFVKPQEGGGGRGTFRLDVLPQGYVLPDLRRLGLPADHIVPLPLTLDPDNRNHITALNWVANRFASSPATSKAYIPDMKLADEIRSKKGGATVAHVYKKGFAQIRNQMQEAAETREQARMRLARAIESYQQLYGVPYQPLICEWIDFGLFGIRAHFRISRKGLIVEALYVRLFPVEFSKKAIGGIGVDSITNRENGGMEFNRYAPLVPPLVASVGGRDVLVQKIQNAFHAFACFLSLLPQEEREKLPVRAEFDISPVSGFVVEGNADPVRGHCSNVSWERFRANCLEWMEDALDYYAWKFRKK